MKSMKYLRLSALGVLAASGLFAEISWAQPATQPAVPPPPPQQPPVAPQTPAAPPAPGTPAPPPAAAPTAPAESSPPGSVPVGPGTAPAPSPGPGTTPYYEQAAPPRGPTIIHVEQPPPPPLEPRTRLYHDGFYLRLSLGFGYQSVSSSSGDSKVSSSGAGLAGDLLIGGTPATGVVVGGGTRC
jgi:hypothetical protein